MKKTRIFKFKGQNSPPLLYLAHTLDLPENGEYFFITANTGFHGDKESFFDHPRCIGGLVEKKENLFYLRSQGKIAFLAGDIQQRTFLRCVSPLDTSIWEFTSYPLTIDFMWAGTNPKIKRTKECLKLLTATNLHGWFFASGQDAIVIESCSSQLIKQIQLFPSYYIYKINNIYIDTNPLYEHTYFNHILNHASVCISTSISEGIFPNVFLEAFSRNMPVIFDKNIQSYIIELNGMLDFTYDGLDNLISKLQIILSNLDIYRKKIQVFKQKYIGANPLALQSALYEVCKNWYLDHGYNWDGYWLGFMAPYPDENQYKIIFK